MLAGPLSTPQILQVRTSRPFMLWLGLHEAQQLQQVPASRAFQHVEALCINIQDSDLEQDCWEDLADVLDSSVQLWTDIQEVTIYGDDDLYTEHT